MIQIVTYSYIDAYNQNTRVNMYDEMTSIDYKPLVVFKSQFTKKEQIVLPYGIYTTVKERYIGVTFQIMRPTTTSYDLSAGQILFGTTDYPLGFYDVDFYENSSNTNMVVADTIKKIYTTLANVKLQTLVDGLIGSTVDYKEYTTNDTDTESVYVTP
tara:strand:+ start:395 stop:865 length:471 start_codon:yes stop_codon:yes gene_type:complete